MTGVAAAQPGRDELTPRVFRTLYADFDLHTVGSMHVAVPRGTPWFAGPSLGEIARQISDTSIRTETSRRPAVPQSPGSRARRRRGPGATVVSAAATSAAGRHRSRGGGR